MTVTGLNKLGLLPIMFIKDIANTVDGRLNGAWSGMGQKPPFDPSAIYPGTNHTFAVERVDQINSQTFRHVSQAISTIVIYSLINRIRLILTDRSMFDKNRASFMSFKSTHVVFSKVFADVLLYILPVILMAIIAPQVVFAKGGSFKDSEWISKLTLNILAVTFVYLITSVGMRFIWTHKMQKKHKIISLSFWILLTSAWMVISAIMFGVKQIEWADIFTDNKYVFAFVPFFNLSTPWLVFYGVLPSWTIVPMIVYTIAFSVAVWKVLSINTKQFLCI